MRHLLTITTDWITAIVALVGLLAVWPLITKWLKERRVPKEIKALKELEQRRDEVKPNFQIYRSANECGGKNLQLKNEGSKAFGVVFSGVQTHIPYTLKPDKYEVEKGEVISIFLGDSFRLLPNEKLHLAVGYADIEGRRYQQSYLRLNDVSEISSPQLFVTSK